MDAVTGEVRTYSQVLIKSLSVANSLWSRGIREGHVVAICSENNLDFVLPVLAAYYIGATCATLNPNYTKREFLKYVVKIIINSIKAIIEKIRINQLGKHPHRKNKDLIINFEILKKSI